VQPEYLEYSEKDDKFRLIGAGRRFGCTINLGRIVCCKPYDKPLSVELDKKNEAKPRSVIFELTDERNALERVLLHFAHFEKTAERIVKDKYTVTVHYDKEDETEVVIRILSFGPMIKVTAPWHFVELIKKRLIDQKSCEQ
jgi:predicted DNA-binding transcriptional regulator YafY